VSKTATRVVAFAFFFSFMRALSGEAEHAAFSKVSAASAAAAFGGIETATCPGCGEVYMIEDADARRVADVPARTSRFERRSRCIFLQNSFWF
jgi:hypothetical protein